MSGNLGLLRWGSSRQLWVKYNGVLNIETIIIDNNNKANFESYYFLSILVLGVLRYFILILLGT